MSVTKDQFTRSPTKGISVILSGQSHKNWKRTCALDVSLQLTAGYRQPSVNLAQLKTLAQIVAEPGIERNELHFQDPAYQVTTDKRLEYLVRQGLIETLAGEHYHDRWEYNATDMGLYLHRIWQKDRSNNDLIAAFQTCSEATQRQRESTINVAQLKILKLLVSGKAQNVSSLLRYNNFNRVTTKSRLKNLTERRLIQPDKLFNKGGNQGHTLFTATEAGKRIISLLQC
ncbi:hypothetical protein N9850_14550 [Granulosicoccus sp.]|nr:hypothetical protein [Granulosicoccus sp.]MDB4224982.1 hypothetical protein [Granulosicoccus sp.]